MRRRSLGSRRRLLVWAVVVVVAGLLAAELRSGMAHSALLLIGAVAAGTLIVMAMLQSVAGPPDR